MTTHYISVDVETASLIPNTYSLLSVGAVLVDEDGHDDYFHSVMGGIQTQDIEWEPETYDWWIHPDQTDARHRINALASHVIPYKTQLLNAAEDFYDWCMDIKGEENTLMFVGWPASFDYPYVQLFFKNAGLTNPFSYRTIDVKSYACGKLGLPFDCDRSAFPDWFEPKPEMPHDALSDAMAQAETFARLLDYEKEPDGEV
jgi:DNA polymerase III epsilon subunit-like protein